MPWWGLLLILAGVVITIRSVRTITARRGPGAESGFWTGFVGVAFMGLGVAAVFGLFPA